MSDENFQRLMSDCMALVTMRKPHKISSVAAWFTMASGEMLTLPAAMNLQMPAGQILTIPLGINPLQALTFPLLAGLLIGGAVHVTGSVMSRQLTRFLSPKGPN